MLKNKNHIDRFLVIFLALLALSSFAAAASVNSSESIDQGRLPMSFVSIAEKLPSGEFKHRVGGVLVFPGAVLTSTYFADHLRAFDGYKIDGEQMYAIFPNEGGKFLSAKIVRTISHYQDGDPEYYGDLMDRSVSLFLFQDHPDTRKLPTIPFMNEEDRIQFHSENPMDSLWAVGAVDYDAAEIEALKKTVDASVLRDLDDSYSRNLENFLCPKSTVTGIGPARMDLTPTEARFLSTTIKSRPGKAGEKYIKEVSDFRSFVERLTHIGHQGRSLIVPRQVEGAKSLKYFCHEHFGYPILWKNKDSKFKVFSLAAVSVSKGSVAAELHTATPMLYGIETLRYLPWMKKKVRESTKTYLETNEEIRQRLLAQSFHNYLEEPVRKAWVGESFHPEFFVNVSQKTPHPVIGYQVNFCSGTLIAEGVVLTAGQCLEQMYHSCATGAPPSRGTGFEVHFRKDSKQYQVRASGLALYNFDPNHRSEGLDFKNSLSMGLVFFEKPDDLPDVTPVDIASKEDWDLFRSVPEGASMLGSSNHGAWSAFTQKSPALVGSSTATLFMRAVSLEHQSSAQAYYHGLIRTIDPARFKSVVLPRYQELTGTPFDEAEILQHLGPSSEGLSNLGERLTDCLKNEDKICTQIHPSEGYVASQQYLCDGAFGSPVLIRNSPQDPWKIVGLTLFDYIFSSGSTVVDRCMNQGHVWNLSVSERRQWIQDQIQRYHRGEYIPEDSSWWQRGLRKVKLWITYLYDLMKQDQQDQPSSQSTGSLSVLDAG